MGCMNSRPSSGENPVVFFDIEIGGRPAGRIEMMLRADVVPRTAEVRSELVVTPCCFGRSSYLAVCQRVIVLLTVLSSPSISVVVYISNVKMAHSGFRTFGAFARVKRGLASK